MYSTIAFGSLLIAASNAIALPQNSASVVAAVASVSSSAPSASGSASVVGGGDQSVTVRLSNQAIELGSQTTFRNVNAAVSGPPVGSSGPFQTIEIELGENVANIELRCSAFDANGVALIARRGTNTDTTFSDADKGEWTFLEPVEVAEIKCDPAFVAVAPGSYDIVVQLSGPSELATQTTLSGVVRDFLPPVASSGPYDSISVSVGPLVNPALRCKVKNQGNRAIVATRGTNTDTTFSDADKGAWAFTKPQQVSRIICDPRFVAAPQ